MTEIYINPENEAFDKYFSSADVVVNLAHPSPGKTSNIIRKAIEGLKPLIISEDEFFLDYSHIIRVPTDEHNEKPALKNALLHLFQNSLVVKNIKEITENLGRNFTNWHHATQAYTQIIDEFLSGSFEKKANKNTKYVDLQIIGDARGNTGIAQGCRMNIVSSQSVGLNISYLEYVYDISNSRSVDFHTPFSKMSDAGKNLFNFNGDMLPALHQSHPQLFEHNYNIGYWAYELMKLPEWWLPSFNLLQEIWAPSDYVKNIIERVSPIPVTTMPHPVVYEDVPEIPREIFNLPNDRFIFVFNFNSSSTSARKNPFGLITAFKKAFKNSKKSPLLVIKTFNADRFPRFQTALHKACSPENIILIEEDMPREKMMALIKNCDCFVSLHRAEGFGLGLAEAQVNGIPVIATGWSGNLDFMHPEHSYLVDYKLVPVSINHHKYQDEFPVIVNNYSPGSGDWAEPKINHAVKLMRHVFNHPEEAKEKGTLAAIFMKEQHSYEAIGNQIKDRLES
ncbi:MAG: glycosyltransferase, partial [Chloroflexota bacterium]